MTFDEHEHGETCTRCNGTGKVERWPFTTGQTCLICKGHGRFKEDIEHAYHRGVAAGREEERARVVAYLTEQGRRMLRANVGGRDVLAEASHIEEGDHVSGPFAPPPPSASPVCARCEPVCTRCGDSGIDWQDDKWVPCQDCKGVRK